MPTRTALLTLVLLAAGTAAADPPETDLSGDPLPEGATARLGTTRMRFPLGGSGVTLLPPEYKEFLAAGADREVGRYEVATGRPVPGPTFPGLVRGVSADGTRAVVAQNGKVEVRDLATGRVVHAADAAGAEYAASLSADGKRLAVPRPAAEGRVVVWDVDRAAVAAAIETGFKVDPTVVLSPDGSAAAIWPANPREPGAGHPFALRVWDVAAAKPRFEVVRDGRVPTAAFSPDGKALALPAGNGGIDLWDAATGKRRWTAPGVGGDGDTIRFSPDGRSVAATARGGVVEWWDLDGRPGGTVRPPGGLGESPYVVLGAAPGGRWVVWGTALDRNTYDRPGGPGLMVWAAWDSAGGKCLSPTSPLTAPVESVGFAAGGREVVTSSGSADLLRWDAATGKPLGRLPPYAAAGQWRGSSFAPRVGLSADARRAVVPELWDLFDPATGASVVAVPHPDGVGKGHRGVVLSADFALAATLRLSEGVGQPGRCDIWDLAGRRKVSGFDLPDGPAGRVASGSFSRDGGRLVLALPRREGDRNAAEVLVVGWDPTTGRKVGEVAVPLAGQEGEITAGIGVAAVGPGSAVLSTISRHVAVDYDGGRVGDTLASYLDLGPPALPRLPPPVVFGPGEAWVAAGVPLGKPGEYGVRVYDWPRGVLLRTFTGHAARVTALTASPDGKRLASGSADTTVLLWDVGDLGGKR